MVFTYDKKYDIMYINSSGKNNSYGDEDIDGFVIMKDFDTDEVTGYIIFDFKERFVNKTLTSLPLPEYIDIEYIANYIDEAE